MNSLTVVAFHGKHRAEEVLDALEQLNQSWVIELDDAVAVYRRDNGTLRIAKSMHQTEGQGEDVGGALGILVGALLVAPFTAGASAAAAAGAIATGAVGAGAMGAAIGGEDAAEWRRDFGISEEFLNRVGGMVQEGDSAIFALIRDSDPEEVSRYFAGWGGRIISTTLRPTEAARVQENIAARF